MNLQEWRKSQKSDVVDITLPSGLAIKVKENVFYPLMMLNYIPLPLLETALDAKGDMTEEFKKMDYIKGVRSTFEMITKIVVEPKIILQGEVKDGELDIMDLPAKDISFLISYIRREKGVGELEPFCNGAASPSA